MINRKQLIEERTKLLSDMQTMLDAANTETRDLTAEQDGQFNTMHTRAEQIAKQIERHDKVIALGASAKPNTENRNHQPGREDINPDIEQRDEKLEEQRSQFGRYLRSGTVSEMETRALTIAGQGVVGIRPFNTTLFDKMKSYIGVREAGAEVVTTSDGNEMTVPTGDDTSNTGRLVGEAATNANETNPTLGNVKLSAFKFSSDWIKISHELLQDANYDVEAYILRKAAERIGRAVNGYGTTGTGTGQPQGVIAAATVGKVAASASALSYEEILDLIHSVDSVYRSMPTFALMLHDTTLAAIRKLKDDAGSYIWSAGAVGAPFTILGYRYVVNNAMDELSSGASSKVIAAGDFSRVMVRDVANPTVIRAIEKFADDGCVGFKVDSRHDVRLLDSTAIKSLALHA